MRKGITASLTVLTVAALGSVSLAGAAPMARPAPNSVRPNGVKPAVTATLYGGGATLPSQAYNGDGNQASGTKLTTFGTGSAFAYDGNVAAYCVTGSGTGRKVLELGNASTACGVTGGVVNQGFGAPSGQTYPDFAASDAPFSVGDYETYTMTGGMGGSTSAGVNGRGIPVQVPAVVGAIAIAVNYTGTIPSGGVTVAGICSTFEGTTAPTWNTLLGNGDNTAISAGFYRGDSSGTSFSFSNWLTNNCSATPAGKQYNVDSLFTNVTAAVGLPSIFVPETGNGGVESAIASTANSVGYVEAAYPLGSSTAKLLKVKVGTTAEDPIVNLPQTGNALNFTAAQLTTSDALTSYTASGSPNGGFKPAIVSVGATDAGLLLVAPSAYSNPSAGYPIVAVSYLDFTSAGNGATKASLLQGLAKQFAVSANFATGKITSIDKPSSLANGKTGYTEPNLSNTTYTTAVNNAASNIGT